MRAAAAVLAVLAAAANGVASEEFLDRLGERLSIHSQGGAVRAKVGGTLDLEFYSLSQPIPGLLQTSGHALFNPRLTLNLDAQIGPRGYVFAQGRLDRGFDPGDGDADLRLEEYAVRYTLGEGGKVRVQAGRFATIVGNWVRRHGSWQNPFITAPLPYENLTGIWDRVASSSTRQLLGWAHVTSVPQTGNETAERFLRTPIIWGPSYAGGAALLGEFGKLDVAIEIKNATLSSHPDVWDIGRTQWQHPTLSGRLGYRPNEMWDIGVSASSGTYLRTSAAPTLARGRSLDDYRQIVLAHDIGFAWRHWQVWAEVYAARFEIPSVTNADIVAGYVEAKYKFTARFFGALRVNRQVFLEIPDGRGGTAEWGRNVTRVDASGVFRFTPHTHFKLQHSVQRENTRQRDTRHTLSAQLTARF